jgi:RimJ/RimL family protein N-acetyltransferase
MKAYQCMPKQTVGDGPLSVQAVQPHHIEQIRRWRNAQMGILRQSALIMPEDQEAYYREHVWPDMDSQQPRNILLAYLENGNLIGYGGLVHISWEHLRAEVSFLIEPRLVDVREDYVRYFSSFLRLMKILAFDDLGFERLFTETYAIRDHHISILENTGFRREGTLKHHVRIDNQAIDSVIHGCIRSYERQVH